MKKEESAAKFIADRWKQGKPLVREDFIPDAQKTKANAPCNSCMGKGVYPEKSAGGREYRCPSCQGSGISPYKVKG